MQYIIDEKDYAILQKAKSIDGKEEISLWCSRPTHGGFTTTIYTNDEALKVLVEAYNKDTSQLSSRIGELFDRKDELNRIKDEWWYKLFGK